MKKQLFTSLLLVSIAFTLNAKVWTVSNNPVAVAQYNTITGAIGAASAGDTIYVAGSSSQYDNIVINKRLVIIGAGFGSPSTPTAYGTTIGTVNIDSAYTVTTSGTKLIGLYINYSISYNNNSWPKNITIQRCFLNSTVNIAADGWTIADCVVNTNISIANTVNPILKIYNNIIYGYIQDYYYSTPLTNLIVDHNCFVGSSNGGFYNVSYATITNNLFWQVSTLNTNNSFNTFSNNMAVSSNPTITIPNGTADAQNNNGSGNLNLTDPKFVNVTSSYYSNYSTYISQNFHLKNGSPAAGKALDGTDLGIYGGLYPWFNNIGVSNIPQITQLNIANPNVAKNGTLNVNVTAIIQK
jgi:hypothetical protein